MGMVQEFKEFAVRGNVMDMAVGLVIGAAFGKIVTSLVNDVIMPPIGLMLGKMDFSYLAVVLATSEGDKPPVLLKYGAFINTVIDFVIVAFAIFLVIKMMNRLRRKQEAAPKTEPPPQEKLLAEIRDLLKAQADK